MSGLTLTVKSLESATWDDFETVMGKRGGARGCWCMHWRLRIDEWMENKGEGNKAAMRELAEGDRSPGIVGYLNHEPVAWCGFGDRADFSRLRRSTLLKSVDDEPVVSLTCLFMVKSHRGEGLLSAWIAAVCGHIAKTSPTRIVEAYPVEPRKRRRAGPDTAMTGISSAFTDAGFTEVARRKHDRPVLRYELP
ncbi:Uncharacterised protein [Brevibacterium casei]|uniref:GNAT family N-acetyltransferase n=2 Tax=Brevibacterium casei TaxID=33889 RepID=A0A449D097_9MICO|nr:MULTISPECIES: GNAT family N-acetyltransferase [Brevibacterium]MCM1013161.1 hypothetical protein [Brevibacterium sp. XM4083]QPS34574.1 hypothetical protein I6G59_04400 [Brevibacterium casei]VEW10908.1 Uncharacterised protein [Brevibacterium casei]